MKKQARPVLRIPIIEYGLRQRPTQRKRWVVNVKKSELKQRASAIHKKMPDKNELNELCYQLKKKINPLWIKINPIQAKLEVALKELEAVSKEIKSLLSDQGHLLKPKERADFQISQEKATESIKHINFLLGQINAKRLPNPRKKQKQQSLEKYNAAKLAKLLAKIKEQK